MIWEDEGYLLSKANYSENSIIVDVFTSNHGRCSGIIYGGSSRKLKKYLQVGNKIHLICKSKSENKLGYFQTELIKAISPLYFNDKKRTSCILSASSILKVILAERQSNKNIYMSFEKLFESLSKDHWIIQYIQWELLLIKELGYDLNLNKDKKLNIKINDILYKTPKLFINDNSDTLTKKDICDALQFNKNLIANNFLDDKLFKIPRYRAILEKYYS